MNNIVSIIIPVYNAEKYLNRCIESVISQTYNNIEILLIDDGSTDKSGEICDIYAKNDSRIKVVHKKNSGVSDSRNLGIAEAKGKYIYFIDSDDYIDNNMIEELINNIGEVDIIKSSRRAIKGNKEKEISINGEYSSEQFVKQVISGNIGGHCWGYLFSRDIIKDLTFDTNTFCMEDTIFTINCVLRAKKIKCIDSCFYNHVINPNGITCSKDKVLDNVKSYNYSIDKIKELLNKNDIFYDNLLLEKKIAIIEAEIGKSQGIKQIKNVVDDIYSMLDNISSKNISKKYYLFIYLIKKKNYIGLWMYYGARRIIKKIYKG